MKTVYACTFVEKSAEEDHFENGCDPSTLVCLMHERCSIQADTLPGLLKSLGKQFCLEIDDVFVSHDDGEINRIGFNRLEDEEGNEPTADQKQRWEQGDLTLYLADYDFLIEKRTVEPIHLEDFTGSGIKFHG